MPKGIGAAARCLSYRCVSNLPKGNAVAFLAEVQQLCPKISRHSKPPAARPSFETIAKSPAKHDEWPESLNAHSIVIGLVERSRQEIQNAAMQHKSPAAQRRRYHKAAALPSNRSHKAASSRPSAPSYRHCRQ